MVEEVKVTRKYQITIPRRVRSALGIKIGDKLLIEEKKGRVLIEVPKRMGDPSGFLWGLSKRPVDVDVVKLVERSWKKV